LVDLSGMIAGKFHWMIVFGSSVKGLA